MNKEQLLKMINFENSTNKLSELEIGKHYKIQNFEFVKTKYSQEKSESIIANLGEFRVFLPERYALNFKKSVLLNLLEHGVSLVYGGMIKSKNGRDMHDIKFVY